VFLTVSYQWTGSGVVFEVLASTQNFMPLASGRSYGIGLGLEGPDLGLQGYIWQFFGITLKLQKFIIVINNNSLYVINNK